MGILESDSQVVVCTQPRRVAAITLAEYVAKDRGQEIGLANDLDKMCCLLANMCKLVAKTDPILIPKWLTFHQKMTISESITSRSLEMRWAAKLCSRFSVAPCNSRSDAGGISDPLHQQIL